MHRFGMSEKFELFNEMEQPGQPNDVSVEFDVEEPQNLCSNICFPEYLTSANHTLSWRAMIIILS